MVQVPRLAIAGGFRASLLLGFALEPPRLLLRRVLILQPPPLVRHLLAQHVLHLARAIHALYCTEHGNIGRVAQRGRAYRGEGGRSLNHKV